MRQCRNPQCDDAVYTPDDRTGLIHTNKKYICRKKSGGKITAAL